MLSHYGQHIITFFAVILWNIESNIVVLVQTNITVTRVTMTMLWQPAWVISVTVKTHYVNFFLEFK